MIVGQPQSESHTSYTRPGIRIRKLISKVTQVLFPKEGVCLRAKNQSGPPPPSRGACTHPAGQIQEITR